ncbi:MFS transporter [Bartonella sp. HY329]|uniref:MFS transporter n=1 Tax=unclassified Bartonella TaxID=2645622 RepID=UPI0021C7AC31|nr:MULTISPECIES: MFS transporter [unclassified Bartonella]UXM95770.1 MFS transporter [Bartonella sp. HY329]UXN10095.1 MFS transporter [Bartonella sp. HY328]
MANPYREIFRPKGTFGFSLAAIVARFPIAMITISVVAMISASRDNFSLPSLVATTFIGSSALIGPQISRLADKYGQLKIGLPASIICAVSLGIIALAAHYHWPDIILFIAAIFAGFMPSFGAFARARWSRIFGGQPLLRSAFAFESLVDEMIFMIGPVLVMNLAAFIFPEAGMVAAIGLLVIGSFAFFSQTATEPKISHVTAKRGRAAIFDLPVLVIALTLSAIGGIFGVVEVTSIAYAKPIIFEVFANIPVFAYVKIENVASLAYIPVTAYALGSFITGILYGSLNVTIPLHRQLLFMSGVIMVTAIPFFFVNNLWMLTIFCLLAGAACSPTIIICMGLLEGLADKQKFTESMTWAITGMSVGAAIGIAVAGFAIDRFDAVSTFRFALAFAVFSFAIALIFRKQLIAKTSMHEVEG